MAYHNDLGKLGEELAATYLEEQGYEILARNYKFQSAEVDIIAQKDDVVVCVEVKTRNSEFFGDPQSFVTPGKIKHLVKAMNQYLIENEISLETRFDIVAVLKNSKEEVLTHYPDAFYFF